jgi:hypothetical protein
MSQCIEYCKYKQSEHPCLCSQFITPTDSCQATPARMSYHENGVCCLVCSKFFKTGARGLSTHCQRSAHCRSVLAETHVVDLDVDDHNEEEKYCEEDSMVSKEQEDRFPSKLKEVEKFEDKNESGKEEEEEEAEEECEVESEEEEEEDIDAKDDEVAGRGHSPFRKC